jgi:5-methylcytosine-specific restriction endonuclease McrA
VSRWKPSKEQYKKYYKKYHSSTKAKKQRAARNKARREAEKEGKVRKGDGKEVDHIKPLSKGGTNAKSNRRVVSRRTNRSFARNSKGRPI